MQTISIRDPFTGPCSVPLPDVWHHGTQTEFQGFEEGHQRRGEKSFNVLLGHHFAAEREVARSFALGQYTAKGRKPFGWIWTVRFCMRNPRVFEVEQEMDREALEFALLSGILSYPILREALEGNDAWHRVDWKLRFKMQPIQMASLLKDQAESLLAALPLSLRRRVARSYVSWLRDLHHDGIAYGNWMEGGLSAIAFCAKDFEVLRVTPYPSEEEPAPYVPGQIIDRSPVSGRRMVVTRVARGEVAATSDGKDVRMMGCACARKGLPRNPVFAEWLLSGSTAQLCPSCRGFLD